MTLALSLLALAAVAFLATLPLVPWTRRLALRMGLVDRPSLPRKEQAEAIPYGGGLAVFAVVTGLTLLLWIGGGVAARLDWTPGWLAGWPEAWRRAWADGLRLAVGAAGPEGIRKGGALLAGGALMFGLGLYDDFFPLRARAKMAFQLAIATLPILAGYRVTFLLDLIGNDGWRGLAAAAACWMLTWGWIVLVTNAFNLLDNMDGLSGGVAVWASLLFGIVAWQHGQALVAAMLALLAGSLAGFLRHNWPPAKVYLGDGGALFTGYLLGVLTIGTDFYAGRGGIHAMATPVCVLAVPLYDSLSVLYIRYRRGKPLFEGDRNHISHRLVRLGLGRREAVLAVYLLTAITGGAATLLGDLGPAGAATIFGLTLAILLLVWLLETAARDTDDG